MTAFANLSFETAGASPGLAASWTYSSTVDVITIAPYDTTPEAWEDFEEDWANNAYKFAFIGAPTDLTAAQYQTLHPVVKPFENFEEFWNSNQGYVFGLAGTIAVYTGPRNFENFETDWNTNESYIYSLATYPGTTAAVYTPGSGDEDFEGGWDTNQSYVYTFTGTAAVYDPAAAAFDDFEAGWDVMNTI